MLDCLQQHPRWDELRARGHVTLLADWIDRHFPSPSPSPCFIPGRPSTSLPPYLHPLHASPSDGPHSLPVNSLIVLYSIHSPSCPNRIQNTFTHVPDDVSAAQRSMKRYPTKGLPKYRNAHITVQEMS
jgi:hypothetical protein